MLRTLIALLLAHAYCTGLAQVSFCTECRDCVRQFIAVNGNEGQTVWQEFSDTTIDNQYITKFFDNLGSSLPSRLKVPTTVVQTNTFYAGGQSASYFGTGWFSDVRLEQKVNIAGLPIQLAGDVVFQQNHINHRLSGLSISFDYESFIAKYREKISQEVLHDYVKNLEPEEKEALKTRLTAERLRSRIFDNSYQEGKNCLSNTIDSLEKTTPSQQIDSALLSRLKIIKNRVETYENRADSLYRTSLLQEAKINQAVENWRKKWLDLNGMADEQALHGTLQKQAGCYPPLKGMQTLLLSLSKLQIGAFRLNSSAFDVSSVPLNGFSTEIRHSGYYVAISAGQEGRQQRTLPDYVRNYRLAGSGRRIVQIKAGIGMPEETHLHLSFTSIHVAAGTLDSNSEVFAKRNVLLNLDGRYRAQNGLFLDFATGISNADLSGTSDTRTLLQGLYKQHDLADNLATMLRFGWRGAKGNTEISAGYQHVGEDYTTLGNLFLLNNRNTLRLELRQNFHHSKGMLKICYLHGTNAGSKALNPGVRQEQFFGEMSYRLDKRGSRIGVSYSPNYYRQQSPGSHPALYQLNLATASLQIRYPRGRHGQWMSMLQCTNYQNQTQYSDSSTISGFWYGLFSQHYQASRYSCTASINTSLDPAKSFQMKDFYAYISQGLNLKMLTLQQGLQVVRRFYDVGWFAGGSAGFSFNTKHHITIGSGITYLWALQSNSKNQFYFHANIGWMF